jgi:hypothetical protein
MARRVSVDCVVRPVTTEDGVRESLRSGAEAGRNRDIHHHATYAGVKSKLFVSDDVAVTPICQGAQPQSLALARRLRGKYLSYALQANLLNERVYVGGRFTQIATSPA